MAEVDIRGGRAFEDDEVSGFRGKVDPFGPADAHEGASARFDEEGAEGAEGDLLVNLFNHLGGLVRGEGGAQASGVETEGFPDMVGTRAIGGFELGFEESGVIRGKEELAGDHGGALGDVGCGGSGGRAHDICVDGGGGVVKIAQLQVAGCEGGARAWQSLVRVRVLSPPPARVRIAQLGRLSMVSAA